MQEVFKKQHHFTLAKVQDYEAQYRSLVDMCCSGKLPLREQARFSFLQACVCRSQPSLTLSQSLEVTSHAAFYSSCSRIAAVRTPRHLLRQLGLDINRSASFEVADNSHRKIQGGEILHGNYVV
jgi:hypothetical protein